MSKSSCREPLLPRVALILVNWNGCADTLECLHSLQTDSYVRKVVIVVDNDSEDDSLCKIRGAHPEIILLEAGGNLGFTGGNNLGIRHALELGVDYIFLLNNDTVVERDSIASLVETAEDMERGGVFTPVIHYFDKPCEPWFGGSRIDLSRGEALHDNTQVPARDGMVREIPWASGCAMLFPAELLRVLGGFDDRFFLNWEDVDLSLRVRAAGYTVMLVPKARILHKVGRSFATQWGIGTYYHVRNQLLFLRLHAGRSYGRGYASAVCASLRKALRSLLRGEQSSGRGMFLVVRAIWDDFIGNFGQAKGL